MSKDWILPDVIDPPETVCVTIEVPKDDLHIAAFFGALHELCLSYNWEWDGLKSGLAVARVWERQIEQASEQVRTGVNCMLDCDEVEACLVTSPIITIIEGDIVTNEANIIINEADITNNTSNVTINTTNITNIEQGGVCCNVYPDLPSTSEPDELCGAAYKIANEINDHIQQAIIDADTSTLDAWLTAMFIIGGFFAGLILVLWDYVFGHSNPNLDTEVSAAIDEVAEYIYCNEIDMELVQADITASGTMTADAIAAWNKAIDTITGAKIALWAFVGAQDTTVDCSSFSCGGWCYTWLDGDITYMASYPAYGCNPVVTTTEITGCTNTPVTAQSARGEITFPTPADINEIRVTSDTNITRGTSANVAIWADGTLIINVPTVGLQSHVFTGSWLGVSKLLIVNNAGSWLTGVSPDGDGAYAYLNSITVNGDGLNPMPTSSC